MAVNPADVAPDIAALRERHPGWFFCSVWAAAASGPDCRLLCGQRHGVTVIDWTPDAVTAKIRREEARLTPRDLP